MVIGGCGSDGVGIRGWKEWFFVCIVLLREGGFERYLYLVGRYLILVFFKIYVFIVDIVLYLVIKKVKCY